MTSDDLMQRPVLAGIQCGAEYTKSLVPIYKGNPLIESLPAEYTPEEVGDLMTDIPPYDEEQRLWDKVTRMHCVQQIKHFMQPLPYHIRLEGTMSRVIRDGYTVRNPLSPQFARQFSTGFRQILEARLNDNGMNITGTRPSASGFSIIGLSGVGKTTAIERTLLLYPQVISHTEYNGKPFILKQIVWLKLECPASGSLKVLCQNFFRQVDLVLGTNYYAKHAARATRESMVIPMAQIASLHGLGVLVIDEIQRLKKIRNNGEHEMLDFFTELINTIGIPVVLIGTYKSMFLFKSAFAEARRATGQGDHVLSNFAEDAEWRLFLQSLWELQWTKNRTALTNDLEKLMYEESQGIPDIAVKLYMNAQWEAILSDQECLTPKLIRMVADKSLKLVRPMLEALKQGDPDALAQYEDLKPDWKSFNDYLKKSKEKIIVEGKLVKEHQRAVKSQSSDEYLVELITLGVKMGISSEAAREVAEKSIRSSGAGKDTSAVLQDFTAKVLDRISLKDCSAKVESRRSKTSSRNHSTPTSDPWERVNTAIKHKTALYDALSESNLLRPPSDELSI